MDYALRDIKAEDLTPSELVELSLDAEDRKAIAKPFAELANKIPFTRKHGRTIIASADSIESAIVLWKWTRTVRRIGNRHRPPKQPKQRGQKQIVTPPARQKEANGHGHIGDGSTLARPVFEGYEGN